MKTKFFSSIFLALSSIVFFSSCEEEELVNYTAPIKIYIDEAPNVISKDNIITLQLGETSYLVSGRVKATATDSSNFINTFKIYKTNPRTAAQTELVAGTSVTFTKDEGKAEYEFTMQVDNIFSNASFRVIVTDFNQNEYASNFVLQVTPKVEITDLVTAETKDYYYGTYFATWYFGRVYPQRTIAEYGANVEMSFGRVDVDGSGTPVDCLVSPAVRATKGLTSFDGAKATKFSESTVTLAEYNAIVPVKDDLLQPITADKDVIKIEKGKIYNFVTAEGKRGLVYISEITAKTDYSTVKLSAKVQK